MTLTIATFRLLVTGSQDWTDERTVEIAISAALLAARTAGRRLILIHGACPHGADAIADRVAARLGIPGCDIERKPANWKSYGRPAGMIRNTAMVKSGIDMCLAFVMQCSRKGCAAIKPHGSHGTSQCVDEARKLGIPVRGFGFGFTGSVHG